MSNLTEENIRRTGTRRVLALGRAAGWEHSEIGRLLTTFHPSLIRDFHRVDCHLVDGRTVGLEAVKSIKYDEAAWNEYALTLEKAV
jgi:hypothetical protein